MKRKIPHFKTEKEEADYWSKHSPLEHPDEFKDIEAPFEFALALLEKAAMRHKEKKKLLTLRMEESQIFMAKIIAKVYGDNYQSLMRKWIRERILQELKAHPDIENDIKRSRLRVNSSG
jgi:predicted DNA binding CopG/RHH family protein